MIRAYSGKLIKFDITKYNTDEQYYKNLWLKKYNIHVGKQTNKDIKKKIKAMLLEKKI
jgi:hypothetical protein